METSVKLSNPEREDGSKTDQVLVKQLTIIGRGECGKTSILYRLVHGTFAHTIPATPIESETISYSVKEKRISLKIFDTSGQEDYSRFRALTLPVSDYVLVCYSIVDPVSIIEVEDTIAAMIAQKAPAHVKTILCGTKIDCRSPEFYTTEDGERLRERIGAIKLFECSALTGEGVSEIFEFIRDDIYRGDKPIEDSKPGFFGRLFNCCN